MVSRHHSEFRLEGGKCLLFDRNSTFGTFLNGQRVKESDEIRSGAMIQFGAGGPVVCVQITDNDEGIAEHAAQIPGLELESRELRAAERVHLNSETVLLGRDPASILPLNFATVSRRHAEIRRSNGQFMLADLGSYNGTFVNDKGINEPTLLFDNDRIQLGIGGPTIRVIDPANPAPLEKSDAGNRESSESHDQSLSIPDGVSNRDLANVVETLVATPSARAGSHPDPVLEPSQTQPFLQWAFTEKPYISIGRGPDNDIRLDSLQISVNHARFIKDQDSILVEDKGSTNGVHINGKRIGPGRKRIEQQDLVQIGPFLLQANPATGVGVFDTRSKSRIDAININKVVAERSRKSLKLLDAVDLTIQPNEFVGLLGSSGAGKSTLMDVLNGMSQPSAGQVLINNLDLYQHLDSLKQSIGYVPQDDIIHRELTVYRTLLYVAGLRLSRDVSRQEVDQIINEVLDVTGLTERRDVPVENLSGGQRKRVSIAVELITKPSIIFLDEPTSGLDPATEEKIMKLFRRIAESGRTVVLTTHNTANVQLFDKIVVLMHGKLVFYGEPVEALAYFNVTSFKDLYEVLKASPDAAAAKERALAEPEKVGKSPKENDGETVAEEWRLHFQGSELYNRNVARPLNEVNPVGKIQAAGRTRLKFGDAWRQWLTLVRRYIEILARDRATILVLLGQAPAIAFLTYLVINENAPRDFPYFMLSLVATWFGTSVAAREIIRERAVYNRERMVNLGVLPYVASKITVLAVVVSVQCGLLLGTLKLMHYTHLTYLPGTHGGLPHLGVMILTGTIGIALGLLVSAIVKTSQTATSLVPLLLIPQILFSGLNGAPQRVAKVVGVAMPVTWSFDEMKRLSSVETLNEEGSVPKYIWGKTREQTQDYNRHVEEYLANVRTNPALTPPRPPDPPENDNLRNFVTFTHPWGGVTVNPIVLLLMLSLLVLAAMIVLRVQDRR